MNHNIAKTSATRATLAAIATSALISAVSAGEPSPVLSFEQNVSIQMTTSKTVAALAPRSPAGVIDKNGEKVESNFWTTSKSTSGGVLLEETENAEWGVRMVTEKISNKEILEDLIANGDIPGPLSGWSLKIFSSESDDLDGAVNLVATKGDLVHQIPFEVEFGAEAVNSSGAETNKTTFNPDGTEKSFTSKVKSKGNAKLDLQASLGFSDAGMSIRGIITDASAAKMVATPNGPQFLELPGAGKLGGISGSLYFLDMESDQAEVVEGSWSFSAATLR